MCRHPCYRLLRWRAVIAKNMSKKSNSSFLNGRGHLFETTIKVTTDLSCQVTLPDVLKFVQWLLGQCFAKIYVSFLRTQSQFQPPRYLKSCSLVPATTACFIFVPSIVSNSFLSTFKYTALVFFAFSDSPTLPHSISTLRKSCLACLISSEQQCHQQNQGQLTDGWNPTTPSPPKSKTKLLLFSLYGLPHCVIENNRAQWQKDMVPNCHPAWLKKIFPVRRYNLFFDVA